MSLQLTCVVVGCQAKSTRGHSTGGIYFWSVLALSGLPSISAKSSKIDTGPFRGGRIDLEGGDRLWVGSCSGGKLAARSRAGPSIKFGQIYESVTGYVWRDGTLVMKQEIGHYPRPNLRTAGIMRWSILRADLVVKKKPAGSLTRLPTGVTMENACRKESVCPLLWHADSPLRIVRSIRLGWLGCRSERTGVTYHIRRESQEEIGTDCAFTNLIQCGGVEGGDRLWVGSCSGEGIAARSRAGPSTKFMGFRMGAYIRASTCGRRHNKITQ
jgi:hypothetical protein